MDLLPGMECPALTLQALDEGGAVHLPDRAARGGQVLFFFKVECPTSPLGVPAIEALRTHYPTARGGPSVLGISQDEPLGTREWCERHGASFPVALDGDKYAASAALGLVSVPTAVLLDARGRIAAVQEGWSRQGYDDFARAVAAQCGQPFAPIAPEGGPAYRPG